jgi:hypothetical protein
MEPNNNQPINPLGQQTAPQQPMPNPFAAAAPLIQPQPTPAPTPTVSAAPAPAPEAPRNGNKKGLILAVILLILTVGMGYYVFFARNQINTARDKSSENSTVVIPTVTRESTTQTTIEGVTIASPEADLVDLEKDQQGL